MPWLYPFGTPTGTPKVETPVITEPSNLVIQIDCATVGATIWFRIDGGAYDVYVGQFSVGIAGDVVDSYATKSGMDDSDVATFTAV